MKNRENMNSTTRPAKARIATRIAAAVLLTAGLALPGAVAVALPPDGPGPETPGTSSRVWPKQVKVGDRLNFEVSGFPANEVVYIKIDDGAACNDTSHGACVYATQKLDRNGRATGSIVVPQLTPGNHWLRMLGTGDVFDSTSGEKLGYEGYTRRGGNDFTVVAASGGGSSSGGGSTGGGGAAAGAAGGSGAQAGGGTAQGGGATTGGTVAGGSVSLDDVGQPGEGEAGTPEGTDAGAANGAEAGQLNESQAGAQTPASSSIPVVGIAVLAGSVVLGGGALTWALVHKRRAAAASGGGE